MTAQRLAPAPLDGGVDWVFVGRLTGVFSGPISRHATQRELQAAIASGGTTVRDIAARMGIGEDAIRRRLAAR